MESPPTCSPPLGLPACCEPAGECIATLKGSLIPDKWLQTDLGGWNRIWYWVAALTSKNVTGEIPDLPEVNGNFATTFSTARISPNIFPSLLLHERARSDSHRGHTAPQSGSHLLSLVELLLILGNEIQRETLPAFSWVGTSSWPISAAPTARTEGGFGGHGGVYFLQNAHPSGDFLGVLFLTTSFGACYVQRIRIWPLRQTLTLAGYVHVLLHFFFSIDRLDPKNLDSGIWMQL